MRTVFQIATLGVICLAFYDKIKKNSQDIYYTLKMHYEDYKVKKDIDESIDESKDRNIN